MNYKEFFKLLCWPPSINLTARIAPFTFLMSSNCGESSAPTNGRVAPVFNPLWFKKGAEDRGMVVSSLFGGRKWFLSIPISWYVSPDPSNISAQGILLHDAVRCGTDRISSAVDLLFGGGGHCRGVPYRPGSCHGFGGSNAGEGNAQQFGQGGT